MPEEVAHALLVVDPADGLGQQDGNVNRLDLVALQLLQVVGDGVRDDDLVDRRLLDQPRCLLREDAVRGQRVDLVGAALLEEIMRESEDISNAYIKRLGIAVS